MTQTAAINLTIVVAYLVGMLALGAWLARYVRSGSDYFIAGHSLNRWVICGSVMATNVAAVYLVGPAGRAYQNGTALLLMAWTGNMLAAISAVTFLPRFRRLRITTITELLRARYGQSVSITLAGLWIVFYAMFTGVTMLTCATVLSGSFGIPESFRLGGLSPFETVTAVIAGTVILYCLFSGLLAVVYTDLLQSFLIIFGAVILLPLALKACGGVGVLLDPEKIPTSKWVMWRPAGEPDDYRIILMMLVLGLPYWFTSQYMLQRSFAGRTVEEASKGLLWAALLTGPLTLCYIVPAMAASATSDFQPQNADAVLPLLAQKVMPVGLGGLFLAALVAASNSTASSYLNSLATLFEQDVYRPLLPNRSDRHYLLVGRCVTVAAGLVGLAYAIDCRRSGRDLLQSAWLIGSIFQPSIFVVTGAALFFRRATPAGGMACLGVGVGYAVVGAAGGWERLGQWASLTDLPALGAFFQWDHTKAPTRALVGMPLSAAALVVVSLADRGRRLVPKLPIRNEAELFERMRFEPGGWTARRLAGLIVAACCLAGMTVFAFVDRQLPKPWNVPLYLALLSGFVGGMLLCANAFLPKNEIEDHVPAPIEKSFLARYLATGTTWAIVYATAVVVVILLYVWG